MSASAQPLPTDLAGWQRAYREGASPRELLGALRERLEARGPDVAVIHRVSAEALAARIDELERTASARSLPLFGVPFAVKDNIDIAGAPTTAACPAFGHTADRSAGVIRRLEAAGAVWMAKTNLDQFATGLVGTRSPYGRPASVADASRVSGGSSSGSAVMVARGDVVFALGTDTAGSGRVPAGFNGLVGLKPTPGRVGTSGVVPACRTLDCVSIFARSVDDAAAVLAVMEGPDADDAYSRFVPGAATFPQKLRIGVPRDPSFFGDAGYAPAWAAAVARAEALGATLVPIDMTVLDAVAALLYEGPWVAERHAAVRELLQSQPEAFDPTVRRVIERALPLSATDAFVGQYRLRDLARPAAQVFERCDTLMVPTAPGHPTFAEIDADPIGVNARLGTYTNFVNLLGWSALAVPAGTAARGLPFGVTFIAPGGADAALARLGRRFGGVTTPVPDAWPATEPALSIAVVGAHLSGLPLNGQLVERGARLIEATTTAPRYRLHALPGTVPPKPGLVRVGDGGHAIALEVWSMPMHAVGSFLALIPPPLGLGSVELADGRHVHGFLCEPHALAGAPDVSSLGGWRAYLQTLR